MRIVGSLPSFGSLSANTSAARRVPSLMISAVRKAIPSGTPNPGLLSCAASEEEWIAKANTAAARTVLWDNVCCIFISVPGHLKDDLGAGERIGVAEGVVRAGFPAGKQGFQGSRAAAPENGSKTSWPGREYWRTKKRARLGGYWPMYCDNLCKGCPQPRGAVFQVEGNCELSMNLMSPATIASFE